MEELVRRYLAHRRSFGYRLVSDGYALVAFGRFADRVAPGKPLTNALALQWAMRRPALPVTVASRLSALRGFMRFCAALDPRIEVLTDKLTRPRLRRRAPHIYTADQVRLILDRTRSLRPWRTNLRPLTYRTFIGLLACTGLRPGEALQVRDEHFDSAAGTLRVPPAKSSPGRTLPLHPTAVRALERYQMIRRKHYPYAKKFFVGPFGRRLQYSAAQWTFRRLAHGIRGNGARPHPRLYDFRHTFATRLIARWSRQSAPPSNYLVRLSCYLGHKYFHHTYWYVQHDLSALQTAAGRFKRFCTGSTSQ